MNAARAIGCRGSRIFDFCVLIENISDPNEATELANQYRQKSVYSLDEGRIRDVAPTDDTGEA